MANGMYSMKYLKPLRSNHKGDTIVEVLIVVAVLSFILVGAYALSNRSSQGTRQAQERSEGYKYTETQMELLKTFLSKSTNLAALPADGSTFCMRADATPSAVITGIPTDAQQETFTSFTGFNECRDSEFYYNYIQRSGDTFTAHTRWNKVNGQGIDESTMVHRIYPNLASEGGNGGGGGGACPANHGLDILGSCVPCPNGFSSPGGGSLLTACQPIAPAILVSVKKIPPAAGNNTPDCGAAATDNRSGTSVRLTRSDGVAYNGTTDYLSNALFTGLSYPPNYAYSASATAPAGYQMCSGPVGVTTLGLGSAPGQGTTAPATLKMRPVCYQTYSSSWTYDPVPGTYYADHIGWANGRWVKDSTRRAAQYDGLYANGMASGAYGIGGNTVWLEYHSGPNRYNQSWYNGWFAAYVADPVYGAPYWHAYQWNEHRNYYNVCP